FTILRNLYYDGIKKYEHRFVVSLDEQTCDGDGPTTYAEAVADAREEGLCEKLEREEAAESVREAFESLSREHRAVLTFCDVQGMKYDEIAAKLDCSSGTVRSRLWRARAAFKKALLEREEASGL